MLLLQTVKMFIMITGSVDTCPPSLALCKRLSVRVRSILGCVCVFSHLQSEQLVGVYSVASNGDGGLRKGESWQPEYRHPIQSVRKPHVALETSADGGGSRGRARRILSVDGHKSDVPFCLRHRWRLRAR